jgi:hypothetical protein
MSLSEDITSLTKTLRAAHDNRVAAVSAQRVAAGKQLADLRSEQREKATAQRTELQQFAATLRQNVATLIHDLDAERTKLDNEQRSRLDTFKRGLQQEVANFMKERAAERHAADTQQRQQLDEFLSTLRKQTSSFLAEIHAARVVLHTDQGSAQQAWQQFSAHQQQIRAGTSLPTAEVEQPDESNTETRPRRAGKRQPKAPQDQE